MPQHHSSHSSLKSRLELLHVTVFTPKYTSPALVLLFTFHMYTVHSTCTFILLSERCNHVFPEHSYSVHVYYDFSWKCHRTIPLSKRNTLYSTDHYRTYTALAFEIRKFKRFPSLLCFSCSSSAFLFWRAWYCSHSTRFWTWSKIWGTEREIHNVKEKN